MRLPAALLALIAFAGCGTPRPILMPARAAAAARVPASSTEALRVSLAADSVPDVTGTWSGAFLSPETGLAGTLHFTVGSDGQPASGYARLSDDGLSTGGSTTAEALTVEALTVEFSRAADGWLEGRLGAYRDPGCGCWITTTFRGRLLDAAANSRGDRLLGTYTARAEAGEVRHGAWTASRVP